MLGRKATSLVLALVSIASGLLAQTKPETPAYDIQEHYTKYEYRIPMRDGVRLFTAVYVPKESSRSHPFLINRTPYSVSPYGIDQYRRQLGPSPDFDKAGYIFVFQDVRGRYMSEGTFVEMRPHIDDKKSHKDVDDSSDLYDTIDWLLKNVANNNGKAGIWGISYPGFFTSASIIDSHPALKAASQGPMKGILEYTEEELVSADFKGNSNSSIVDAGYTKVVGDRCVKVLAWYDNEWAYSCRCRDLIKLMASKF